MKHLLIVLTAMVSFSAMGASLKVTTTKWNDEAESRMIYKDTKASLEDVMGRDADGESLRRRNVFIIRPLNFSGGRFQY